MSSYNYYRIKTRGEGRTFECALHFAIVDENEMLYAASFMGNPSAVWAVSAALQNRREICIENNGEERYYYPVYDLKIIQRKVESFYHSLALPVIDKNSCYTVTVVAFDGDPHEEAGKKLAEMFDLPLEWAGEYWKLFHCRELTVIASPGISEKVPAGAVVLRHPDSRLSLSQETVDKIISDALVEGRLRVPTSSAVTGYFEEGMSLRDYLRANAAVFAKQLSAIRPLHDPEREKLSPVVAMERIPYPAQAHAIAGLAKLLKKERCGILCGDMGTGKSIIALGITNLLYRESGKKGMAVLLTCPGIVLPKWVEQEILPTLPGAKVVKIGSHAEAMEAAKKDNSYPVMTASQYLAKVRNGYRPEGLEFVLVGIDRAKLGPPAWVGAVLWRRVTGGEWKGHYAWHCPDCYRPVTKKLGEEEVLATWNDFVEAPEVNTGLFTAAGYLRKGAKIKWRQKPAIRKCSHCGAVLVRPALKSRGETNQAPRWYAALILKKLRGYFDLYIADEVHQTKAENSGRGFAFAELVRSSKRVLCLTGTLVNGMSTSIKEILWRTTPQELIAEGFNKDTGMVAWAMRYGVLEKVTKVTEDDDGVVTRRRRYQERQPREKPGISPELAARHLLKRSVFLELPDMGLPLVELKETPVVIELDELHAEKYREFHEELRNACMEAYRNGKKGAFSKFIPATINAVDRSDADMVVEVDGKEYIFTGFGPTYYNAKERKLVKIIRENLAEGRGCMVFCNYTEKFAVHHRIRNVLRAHGIECAVLESHVSQEERVTWLAEQARKGTKVIVCNMRLVETGLDLLPWPTIIFYQLNYDINTVRQASRRAWRIGQTRECRVYYLVANGTQQMTQFEVCLEKRAHALLTEGRLDRSELAKYIRRSGAGRTALAADLAECLASEEVCSLWVDLAKRDLEAVETVEESRFLEELKKANERLARETLKLCGLLEEEDVELAEVGPEKPLWAELWVVPVHIRKRKKKKSALVYEQLALPFAV